MEQLAKDASMPSASLWSLASFPFIGHVLRCGIRGCNTKFGAPHSAIACRPAAVICNQKTFILRLPAVVSRASTFANPSNTSLA
jgi:hypothetical protein